MEVENSSENCSKRVKLGDLDSVVGSESQAGREQSNTVHQVDNSDSSKFDLNVSVGSVGIITGDDTQACTEESNKLTNSGKEKMECHDGFTKFRGLDFNLNAEDNSSSINDPFYFYKKYENSKSGDDWDCGSSVGPLDRKDSMWVWNELKQNNFFSAPDGAIPKPTAKPRGRKKNKNDDELKKKIQRAKKENVDRFARFAAPSGLLNGLNPGIINHVRNSKQVHSIIEALVKSEENENRHLGSEQVSDRKEVEVNRSRLRHGDSLLGRRQRSDYPLVSRSSHLNTKVAIGDDDLYKGETMGFSRMTSKSHIGNENAELEVKQSNLTGASENPSCLSNEESANLSSVDSLSVKAANVASQWLELLSQDIKGRLAALKRSKKRTQSVITTELPFLISREFSSNVDKATVDSHTCRWNTLFGQMEKTFSEEETRLEIWLKQVKEMQLHCEKGLHQSSLYHASKQMALIGNGSRSVEVDDSEKDLAVKAAAASIYSTCNFLLAMENQPCC